MASLTDLIARVRWLTDTASDTTNFTDTDITYSLNVAQQDVAKEIVHEYEDYFEKQAQLNPGGGGTIPGIELYTLPSDFLKFKRIERSDTGQVLHPIDLNEKVSLPRGIGFITAQSSPDYYVSGNSVGFSPMPQSTIPVVMTYVYRLPDLSNVSPGTTDISAIPLEHHDMIAIRAAIDLHIKDEADTSALMARWSFLLDQMHRTLRQRQIQEPKHVQRVAWYGPLA